MRATGLPSRRAEPVRRAGPDASRVALRSHSKAQIAFVNFHQRLPSLDLLADINKPRDDFAGNAKAEIALHPGRNDAREAAFGFAGPRRGHESDEWSVLPRVAYGRGFPRTKEKRGECGRPEHREQHAPQHDSGSPFHSHRLTK